MLQCLPRGTTVVVGMHCRWGPHVCCVVTISVPSVSVTVIGATVSAGRLPLEPRLEFICGCLPPPPHSKPSPQGLCCALHGGRAACLVGHFHLAGCRPSVGASAWVCTPRGTLRCVQWCVSLLWTSIHGGCLSGDPPPPGPTPKSMGSSGFGQWGRRQHCCSLGAFGGGSHNNGGALRLWPSGANLSRPATGRFKVAISSHNFVILGPAVDLWRSMLAPALGAHCAVATSVGGFQWCICRNFQVVFPHLVSGQQFMTSTNV